MSDIKLSLDLINNSEFGDISIEVWIDENKFCDLAVANGTHKISCAFPEDEAEHLLMIVMKNKQDHHTTIDDQGNIIDDVLIHIKNVTLDDISLDNMMYELAEYYHNTNGNSEYKNHKYCGTLGCNGTVTLKFYTPLYMWLLEHM